MERGEGSSARDDSSDGGSSQRVDGEDPMAAVSWKAVLTLGAFCFHTAGNAFAFMNYTSIPNVARVALGGISAAELNGLYSVTLLTVVPCTLPTAYFIEAYTYPVMMVGVAANAAGAWLRLASVVHGSYALAVAGSVALGVAVANIVTAVAFIPERWFPSKQRLLACSIGAQANYLGWFFGGLLHPNVVPDVKEGSDPETSLDALRGLLVVQGVVLSAVLLVSAVLYRGAPPSAEPSSAAPRASQSHASAESLAIDFGRSCRALATRRFVVLCLCFSAVAGVSWVVPGVQAELFDTFTARQAAWTNAAFMGTGVVAGLLFGLLSRDRLGHLLLGLVCLAAASMACIGVLTYYRARLPFSTAYPLLLLFMALCGLASLGFIGPALDMACAAAPGVSPSISGGAVLWCLQIWGALLTQASVGDAGFFPCAAVTAGAAGVLLWHADVLLPARQTEVYSSLSEDEGDAADGRSL